MTNEEINFVFSSILEAQPVELFKLINGASEGIGFVLNMLFELDHPVSAGEISDKMKVSTARVAVLLRKMKNKGFITKETDRSDARVTIVNLTEFGRQTASSMRKDMQEHLSIIIDIMGMDKVNQYISLSKEIKEIAESKLSLKDF